MLQSIIETPSSLLNRIADFVRSSSVDNLMAYTAPCRVEPIMIVDPTVLNIEFLQDTCIALQALYAGTYLQAASLSINIGSVRTLQLLDKLSPSRSPADSMGYLAQSIASNESHVRFSTAHSYPLQVSCNGDFGYKMPTYNQVSALEADENIRQNQVSMTVGRDAIKQATETTNMAVGSLVELRIEQEGVSHSVQVNIRLMPTVVPLHTIKSIAKLGAKDVSVKERWHDVRSGRVALIADTVFCNDLIREHRSAMINDSTGTYMAIVERRNKNRLAGLLSGNPSVANASSILLVSRSTLTAIEQDISGKFSSYKVRQRFFENTFFMIVAVLDPMEDEVTFYYNTIPTPTTVSARGLKAARKNTGPDVSEILKAYQLGNNPTF